MGPLTLNMKFVIFSQSCLHAFIVDSYSGGAPWAGQVDFGLSIKVILMTTNFIIIA